MLLTFSSIFLTINYFDPSFSKGNVFYNLNIQEFSIANTLNDLIQYQTYGPIRLAISDRFSKDGIFILEGLNKQNQKIFLAIHCELRLINVAGKDLSWKTWIKPLEPFEKQLLTDMCILDYHD